MNTEIRSYLVSKTARFIFISAFLGAFAGAGFADGSGVQKLPTRITNKAVEFSQAQYRRLGQARLEALKNNPEYRERLFIDHFSPSFAQNALICMSVCMRSRTNSFLRRIQRADSRRIAIEDEIDWANEELGFAHTHIIQMMDRPKNAFTEGNIRREEENQENLRCYIKSLRKWLRRPHEGLLDNT